MAELISGVQTSQDSHEFSAIHLPQLEHETSEPSSLLNFKLALEGGRTEVDRLQLLEALDRRENTVNLVFRAGSALTNHVHAMQHMVEVTQLVETEGKESGFFKVVSTDQTTQLLLLLMS